MRKDVLIKNIKAGDLIEIEYNGDKKTVFVTKYLESSHDDDTRLGCWIDEKKCYVSIYKLNITRIFDIVEREIK